MNLYQFKKNLKTFFYQELFYVTSMKCPQNYIHLLDIRNKFFNPTFNPIKVYELCSNICLLFITQPETINPT